MENDIFPYACWEHKLPDNLVDRGTQCHCAACERGAALIRVFLHRFFFFYE